MCSKCEKFIGLPEDRKAKEMLFDKSEESIDSDYFIGFMEMNHDDNGNPEAFIKQEVKIKSTGRTYGVAIDIKYCPFCGEKLY